MKRLTDGLIVGTDGRARCWWAGEDELYMRYHDNEWGMPQGDDRRLFEKICLEGFQAGLSWITILRKREAFRKAFVGFDFVRVARWGEREVAKLLQDDGIIRHRGKIESTINNARRAIDLAAAEGSLAAYFWRWLPPAKERPKKMTKTELCKLGATPTATALGKDLKKRGWTFVGGTTVYAFMQAMGLVDDHVDGCLARERVESARKDFMVKRSA